MIADSLSDGYQFFAATLTGYSLGQFPEQQGMNHLDVSPGLFAFQIADKFPEAVHA